MAMPELVKKQAETILLEYCSGRRTSRRGDQHRLTFEIAGDCLTLFAVPEGKDAGKLQHAIARLCYNHQLRQWTLHYPGSNGEWRFYLNAGPTLNLGKLLRHVDEDPLGVFWP